MIRRKKMKTLLRISMMGWAMLFMAQSANASIEGTYYGILKHESTDFYQYATITLRTVQTGESKLKISANVRIFFGDLDSNEYMTYEFPEVERYTATGQLTMREAGNDVSLIGKLKPGVWTISGDWYSSQVGRVGTFTASKERPTPPEEGQLIELVTNDYKGTLDNTHPDTALPAEATMTLVARQNTGSVEKPILFNGSTRFYYSPTEYEHFEFEDIQFNFYTRFFTARTKDLGIVYKGTLALDGSFEGEVFMDGYGKVGTIKLKATF